MAGEANGKRIPWWLEILKEVGTKSTVTNKYKGEKDKKQRQLISLHTKKNLKRKRKKKCKEDQITKEQDRHVM